ncbi:mechanosensitive ion channel family protein [Algoriphagus halophytocola]|uniref:Mechanosensitive ion channel family protein n=1 Tax=Algoriphagus halophytocola TaxID=2991499 RepID=A0ABY6MHZ1_9BACT|nr:MULTISPECIES: mechanosensitive ion channel family protein [unclassified Algoriphagus]UZD23412.1 mechanosensitive ion channel family protein [Algoriphagus sp. TR-M5]WBL44707.1 mechanosensitive ion channel family protein [Algoriphagus sp. TR-M9]
MSIAEIFGYDTQKIFSKITEKLSGWLDILVENLPNFVLAVILLICTIFIAKSVKGISAKYISKVGTNETISRFLSQLIFLGILVLGIMLSLSAMDLTKTVSSILAGLGIIGLALGFAFQDTAANFISGVYITFNQPYKIGDIIETHDGHEGAVIDINLRVTKIKTYNGPIVYVPNRYLFQECFTNYTEFAQRRVQVECGVSYGEDLEQVEKVALESARNVSSRLKSEEPTLFWTGFGDSSINFTLNIWCRFKGSNLDFIPVRNEAIISLKKAFDENDIMIPFPIRTLDFGIKGGNQLNQQLTDLSISTKNGSSEDAES